MTTEEKRSIFEQAKKKREAERENESKRGSWEQREYESIAYLALEKNKDIAFRILGNPLSDRRESSDPKLVNISMIVDDNGKKFRCIFPEHETNKDWILWKIYDLVLDGKWEGTGDHRQKVFYHETKHPECFNRVRWNNNQSKLEKGWTPKPCVVMNVIDRQDMKWHKENKHTKLLSSRVSEFDPGNGKDVILYFDPGVPKGCYNKIWDDVVEYGGLWEDYDIVVRKLADDPWYKAFHSIDDSKKLSEEVKNIIYEGELSSEEASWERYDLDKFFNITSYNKIKSKLGGFIKKVDVDFGTSFYPELEKLAEDEKKKWEEEHKNETVKVPVKETKEDEVEEDEDFGIPVYEEKEEVQERKSASSRESVSLDIPWDKLADGSYNGTKYLGISEMTDEEKDLVIGINSDGSFEYKPEAGTLYKDTKSGFKSPGAFHVDPLSGGLF